MGWETRVREGGGLEHFVPEKSTATWMGRWIVYRDPFPHKGLHVEDIYEGQAWPVDNRYLLELRPEGPYTREELQGVLELQAVAHPEDFRDWSLLRSMLLGMDGRGGGDED